MNRIYIQMSDNNFYVIFNPIFTNWGITGAFTSSPQPIRSFKKYTEPEILTLGAFPFTDSVASWTIISYKVID